MYVDSHQSAAVVDTSETGELFTVSLLTIVTAAPISISMCPSTSIVVCNGLLLLLSTRNSEYSVIAGSLDSWLTSLLLALGSGFLVSECLPGPDLQTLAMWPCLPHELFFYPLHMLQYMVLCKGLSIV